MQLVEQVARIIAGSMADSQTPIPIETRTPDSFHWSFPPNGPTQPYWLSYLPQAEEILELLGFSILDEAKQNAPDL